MYRAQINCLYNQSQRPVPGDTSINKSMWQFVFAGPLVYSLGSMCWSSILSKKDSGSHYNILALLVSIGIMLFPYNSLVKKIIKTRP